MKLIPGGLLAAVSSLLLGIDPVAAADYSASAKVLYQFSMSDAKGFNPLGAPFRATDGAFYGTTAHGGTHGHGTLYKIHADGSGVVVLHHFRDSRNPSSSLVEGKDGLLYGTSEGGGSRLVGTVFKINKDGQNFTQLYQFTGSGADGKRPQAGVTLDSEGTCYGTTSEGGRYLGGTVFRVDTNGGRYRVLYGFIGKQRMDGSAPRSALLLASDGSLYGTTSSGGRNDFGTIFAIERNGGRYRLLHAFGNQPTDGATPYARLIEGSDGKLYGSTIAGGYYSHGTVCSIGKDGKGYRVLRSFGGLKDDGRNIYSPLVEGPDALLYSTAANGGDDFSGLIFRIAKDGRDYTPLFVFSAKGLEGRWPYGGIALAGDGTIFGTTTAGAEGGQGAIFKLGKASP